MKTLIWFIALSSLLGIIVCAADLTTLGQSAAPGEIPKWNGTEWRNAHDNVGVQTVEAGPGVVVSNVQTGRVAVSISASNQFTPPIGAVLAWMKSLPGMPALPDGWVECNGQTLADATSPLNGQVIPALNGTTDANKRFLRGASTSGGTGGAPSSSHSHGTIGTDIGSARTVGNTATAEVPTIPPYYEVVWIIRVK